MIAAALQEPMRSAAVSSSEQVVRYLQATIGQAQVEEMRALYLDDTLALLRDELVARGSRRGAVFDHREIVRRALELGAGAVLVAHNHPSGNTSPSPEDIAATRALAEASRLFDVRLVDHIIVSRRGWTSLAAEGFM